MNVRVIAGFGAAAVFAAGILIGRAFAPTAPTTVQTNAPARASSAALNPPSNQQQPRAIQQLWSSESASATKKSLDAVLADGDPRRRTTELENFINNLRIGEYADALKRIRQIPGNNDRELASRLLVARWVQTDADGALQFAASNRGYEYIADSVFQQAAMNDTQAALERAKSLPNADLRYMALRGVLSFMADADAPGALHLAPTLGEFPGNEPLTNVIYRQWASNDPQAAAAQATQDNAGEGWRSPVGQVVRTWAAQDPAAAANWSLSLPNGEAQSRSVAQVMRQWTRNDPTSAAQWVNSLPSGTTHDAAVAGLATSFAGSDPQLAVNWASNIADEATRNRTLEQVSREAMWRDPANAANVLKAAGVPETLIPQPGGRGRPPGG